MLTLPLISYITDNTSLKMKPDEFTKYDVLYCLT